MLSCGIEKMVRNMYLERKCKTYLPENLNVKIFVKISRFPGLAPRFHSPLEATYDISIIYWFLYRFTNLYYIGKVL